MAIKVLPTLYNSILFRSRLEARWAVFFDSLKINWLYEFEGYDLDGVWYLPDFYLPKYNGGCYVEVKPTDFSVSEHAKLLKICTMLNRVVFKAVGAPDLKWYEIYFPDDVSNSHPYYVQPLYSNFCLNYKSDSRKRFWVEPSQNEYGLYKEASDELIQAVLLAKSYRF